jgi:RNA polymerase sigma-70 factor (ECF subfamily)
MQEPMRKNEDTTPFSADAPATDQELITRALKKDQAALNMLIKRHLKLVYNIALKYTADFDDAQDITQEVFVKVWQHLDQYRMEKSFINWLFEITKNTSLNWLKKRRSVPFSAFENAAGENYLYKTLADPAPTPYEQASRSGVMSALRSTVARLSPIYRQVVVLHDQKELTFQEIANGQKQSMNTVKSRYRRAVMQLKKIFIE